MSRAACGALLLALVWSSAARGGAPSPASREADLRRTRETIARLSEAREDLSGALRVWRALLARYPGHPPYQRQVARLARYLDRPAVAVGPARALVRRWPERLDLRLQLIWALDALHRTAEIVPHLIWAVARRPADAALRLQLARACETLGLYRRAIAQYDWLLRRPLLPGERLAHRVSRAGLLGALGDADAELRELLALARDAPADPAVRAALATFRLESGRLDLAAKEVAVLEALARRGPSRWRQEARRIRGRIAVERARLRARARLERRYADWLLDMQLREEDF